jgi:branched-subunit amino acid transport protein
VYVIRALPSKAYTCYVTYIHKPADAGARIMQVTSLHITSWLQAFLANTPKIVLHAVCIPNLNNSSQSNGNNINYHKK